MLPVVKLDASRVAFGQSRERAVTFKRKLGHLGANLNRGASLTSRGQVAVTLGTFPTANIYHVIIATLVVGVTTTAMLIDRSKFWFHGTTEMMIDSVALLTCFLESIQTF